MTVENKEYRAIVNNPSNGNKKVESIWFESKMLAEASGENGVSFYEGTDYEIETRTVK